MARNEPQPHETDRLLIRNEEREDESTRNAPEIGGSSSILGTTLNLTNAIMGAGCISYGGAVAESGGLVSIALIIMFAVLTLWSFDVLIELGLDANSPSYEDLATKAAGSTGLALTLWSKALFSFGCMCAYIIIIKDNFSVGVKGLIWPESGGDNETLAASFLDSHQATVTLVVCLTTMLPLCFLRSVTPLERFSSLKVILYGAVTIIVIYLYATLPREESPLSFRERWLVVKPGVIPSMGTFLLAFVAAHTLHMFFRSMHPSHLNMKDWRKVSSSSIVIALAIFLSLALFSYMTYWDETSTDLLEQYPDGPLVNISRLFLSVAMTLTYPMPMFSLREQLLLVLSPSTVQDQQQQNSSGGGEASKSFISKHLIITLFLFCVTFVLAMSAKSLGAVMNVVGCVSGTLISFVLPGLFSIKLQGPTWVGLTLLIIGGAVGTVGTVYSIKDLFVDG